MTSAASAPRGDAGRRAPTATEPSSPQDLHRGSWKYAARRTLWEFLQDQCIDSAGALTYFGVLSLFPALLALMSLLGVIGQGRQAASALVGIIRRVAPGSASSALRGPIEQFVTSPAAGITLVTGIVLAVWTASGYVSAFTRAMNRIYEVEEGRPYVKRKGEQLLITLALIVLVACITAALVVSGPVTSAIGAAVGLGPAVQIGWAILKWPLLAAAAVALIALLYWSTPNVRQPKFRWISIGGLVALVVLAVASTAFLIYAVGFSHYGKSYGSLAGIIVFLIWLWIANLALLFGAEFDSELERGRELQAGLPAETRIQLTPRDDSGIRKTEHKEAHYAAIAHSVRESAGRKE